MIPKRFLVGRTKGTMVTDERLFTRVRTKVLGEMTLLITLVVTSLERTLKSF